MEMGQCSLLEMAIDYEAMSGRAIPSSPTLRFQGRIECLGLKERSFRLACLFRAPRIVPAHQRFTTMQKLERIWELGISRRLERSHCLNTICRSGVA